MLRLFRKPEHAVERTVEIAGLTFSLAELITNIPTSRCRPPHTAGHLKQLTWEGGGPIRTASGKVRAMLKDGV